MPWDNFVPYQQDIAKALRDLQDEVFAKREYRPLGETDVDYLDQAEFFDPATPEAEREELLTLFGPLREPLRRMGPVALRDWLIAIGKSRYPETREEFDARHCLTSSGTGTALDMVGLSAERMPGYVAPLASADLVRHFGTDRPTRAQVEAHLAGSGDLYDDILEDIGGYGGVYIVLYDGSGAPSELFFAGYSPY